MTLPAHPFTARAPLHGGQSGGEELGEGGEPDPRRIQVDGAIGMRGDELADEFLEGGFDWDHPALI